MSDEKELVVEETEVSEEITEENIQTWWRESAFVIEGEKNVNCKDADPPKPPSIYDTLKDILPALREEGELRLQGRRFSGMTEWIPGVDPVGDLIEDTWLPPLPPAITTKMRTYEDVEGDEPGGGGHLNIMIDLSASMSSEVGLNSNYQSLTLRATAMTLTSMLITGCQKGLHTFTIGGYGSSGGNNGVLPMQNLDSSHWRKVSQSTRIIWGRDDSQRKDYIGAIASINNQVDTGESNLWSWMSGTRSGAAMARMYYFMTEQMKGTEIRTAPLIFISDCEQRDLDVPSSYYTMEGDFPRIDFQKIMADGEQDTGSIGFWYWARKYSRECGPVILIQMTPAEWAAKLSQEYVERIRQGFIQIIGQGEPASEFEKCYMPTVDSKNNLNGIFMSPTGGNIRIVAQRLNEFIKDMNGEGEICCGGKGISFDNN